jgi:hypothetical protein
LVGAPSEQIADSGAVGGAPGDELHSAAGMSDFSYGRAMFVLGARSYHGQRGSGRPLVERNGQCR